jgi:DSF synthase
MTIVMSPKPRPCFTPQLLAEGADIWDQVRTDPTIKAVLVTSDIDSVFNLGGDLNLFLECVDTQNWSKLRDYGRACIDNVYNMRTYPKPTIAVVQGAALGGGFEGALAAQYLVAEKGSVFGFPEAAFNLFPGMGAYSLLRRHVGDRVAKRLISSQIAYAASIWQERYDLFDRLVDYGEGLQAARELALRLIRRDNTTRYVNTIQRVIDEELRLEEELEVVLGAWLHAVMNLSDKDLQLMRALVKRQNKVYGGQE